MASESRTTVLVAAGANLFIAVTKIGAGLIAGSAALLAEGAHSVADTMNQVFLLVSLSLGQKPPDETHPFGYGKERFFWAFLAAAFIFVSGSVFSFVQGITGLISGGEETSYAILYVVLAVALVAESVSWYRAYRQTSGEAKENDQRFLQFVKESKDPTVKTVLLEDSAAVIGIAIAFLGIGLSQITGQHWFDPAASIAIGILLAYVAFGLGRNTKGLLLGESATPDERRRIKEAIESHPEVEKVLELLTMSVGPESLLVAARIDLSDRQLSGDEVEELAERIDGDIREAVPTTAEVFLDPTPGHARTRRKART